MCGIAGETRFDGEPGDMGVATTPLPDTVQFLEADGTESPEGAGQA